MAVGVEEVMAALRSVPEPCSIAMKTPLDITEMGLVEDVAVDGGSVAVVLVLTDPSCVHFLSMRRFIRDALLELDGVDAVEVTMSTTQLWTSDRLARRPASV
jgi:metal-sulfur cluster biosynthetic enzyme